MYSSSRHALGLYRGIANACQYVVPAQALRSESGSLKAVVESALARTILRLGSLRVGIIDEDTNKPCFTHIPSINLHEIIEWTVVKQGGGSSDLESELLRVIENRLDQAWCDMHLRPPWKLIVVEDSRRPAGGKDPVVLEMVFAAHHAISDGKSTALLHTVLLEELNRASEPPSTLRDHVLSFHDSPVLAPTQEELVKFNISWSFLFRCLWDEFGPAWLKSQVPERPWTGKAIALAPNGLNLRCVAIPSDVVQLVLTACRSRSTTFTALLHALVLCSLSARAPANVATAFSSSTAISLQPFARLPPGVNMDLSKFMTDMNTAMSHKFGAQIVAELRGVEPGASKENLMWRSAEALRAEIKKRLDTLPDDDITGLLAWVGDWRKHWLALIGKPRDDTWSVSNIGSNRYNGGSGGDAEGWRIQRSIFTQPAMVAGPAFAVNVSGVDGGVITLTLNWQEGIVEAGLIEGIARDLQAWFKHFKQTQTFGGFRGCSS